MSFFSSLFENNLSDHGQVKYDLALIHLEKGDYDRAWQLLEEAEATDEAHPDLVKLRQVLEAQQSNGGAAEEEAEAALEKDFLIFSMPEFEVEKVQNFTDNSFLVEAVAYGNGEWVFAFRRYTEKSVRQEYMFTAEFDNESFTEYVEEDYYLSQAASDGENWFLVMEYRPEVDDQPWVYSPGEYPKEELMQWEQQGYAIDVAVEAGGNFLAAASFPHDFEDYEASGTESAPEEKLVEIWDEDFWLQNICFMLNRYFFFFGRNEAIEDQGLSYGERFPLGEVDARVEAGSAVHRILFANGMWLVTTQKKKLS